MLLFNKRLNAQEAYERNLVNEIVADKDFHKVCEQKLEKFSKIPKKVEFFFSNCCRLNLKRERET